mgnify:CR=1 FL=1
MTEADRTTQDTLDKILVSQERIADSLNTLNQQLGSNTINGTVGGATAGGIMAVAVTMIKNAFTT